MEVFIIMNHTSPVLFSVIMLTYNHENFIEDAIESILRQDYQQSFEFFVFDDASVDGTREIIERISIQIPTHIIFQYVRHDKNIGSVANFNLAMSRARGDIIVVADGDDISLPCRLSVLASVHQKYQKSLYVSNAYLLRVENTIESFKESKFYSNFEFDDLSIGDIYTDKTPVFGASYAFHRELFDKYKEIDSTLVTYNNVDQQIFWRAYLENGIHYLHEQLLMYRVHKQGLSLNKVNDFDQIKKIQYYLNRIGNILCLMQYHPVGSKEILFEKIKLDFDCLISVLRHLELSQNFDESQSIQLGYGDAIIFNGICLVRNITELKKLRLDEFIFVLNKLFLDEKLNETNFFLIYNACKQKEISKSEIVVLFYLLSNKFTMPLKLTLYDYAALIFLICKNKMRVFRLRNRINL